METKEFKMKDGSLVSDPRLGCLMEYDDRNKNFMVTSTFSQRKPFNKVWYIKNLIDQGYSSSCVGTGSGNILRSEAFGYSEKKITQKFCYQKIYCPAQYIDPWPGGECTGKSPLYGGTSPLAGAKILVKLGLISGYFHAFTLTDVILGVCYSGPCGIAIPFTEGMMKPDENFYIHPTGDFIGNHFTVIDAVDWENERFRIANSWGPLYGDKGRAWMSFKDTEVTIEMGGTFIFYKK